MPLIASAALQTCTNILGFIDTGHRPGLFCVFFFCNAKDARSGDLLTPAAVPTQQKMIEAKLKLLHRLQYH
jgi:hypothetical protein